MSCNLPPMVFSNPDKEEVVELDFGVPEESSSFLHKKVKSKKDESDEASYSQWNALPDILLEDIFSRLSIKERYNASQVCWNWYRLFHSKKVWEVFILEDKTLTRRKFNYYLGYQFVLDHYRTQLCLNRVIRGVRKLIIRPMENFFNLYEFMSILSYFSEKFEPLDFINTLDFTFGCEYAAENSQGRDKIFGTGGKLLEALKHLMMDLRGLKHLALRDLYLETEEAQYLLDDVAYNSCETLRTLKLVNCSKEPYAMLHPAVFINLQKLTISPQHLGDDVLLLLASTKLKELYLLQTKLTIGCISVSYKVWKEFIKLSPFLRVHHVLESGTKTPIAWQEGAPVRSIIYDTPESEILISCIYTASNIYCNTLEVFAYLGLPQYNLHDSFDERADISLILLSRCCLYLDTLVIREHISSSTLLLLASQSRNLRRLIVRRSALIMKCDWPHNPEWTEEFYFWLRMTSISYDKLISEVSKCLEIKWHPLSDEEFQNFKL
ncbi:uncharacterized protein [Parasteatoda tepidariorum]|uniref:uncharacterized protein n=1 Tax=Parasteatoda tepidariorum TaxID=114398 RepID=UPI00077FCB01|nr:uncharacterized protein LOC107451504 [Parasteatoda tepidariorum]